MSPVLAGGEWRWRGGDGVHMRRLVRGNVWMSAGGGGVEWGKSVVAVESVIVVGECGSGME